MLLSCGRWCLRSIDLAWMEHLELMDYARSSAGLRSYGQREPLMEYRKEGNQLFSGFWGYVRELACKQPVRGEESNKA